MTGCKHEAPVPVQGTGGELLRQLALAVAPEGCDGSQGESYGPAAGVLRLGEDERTGLLSVPTQSLKLAVHA